MVQLFLVGAYLKTENITTEPLSDYKQDEEVFFDIKPSDSLNEYSEFDLLTEDQMPIPENISDDVTELSEKELKAIKKQPPKAFSAEQKSNQESQATDVSLTKIHKRREATYNIIELTFSKPVKIMKKNKAGNLLKVRIIPAITLSDNKKITAELNKQFEKATIYQSKSYTELLIYSKGRVGTPYTAYDSANVFKLCIPYQNQRSRFSLRKGQKVAEGLTYYKDRGRSGDSGFSDVHILRVEPMSTKVKVLPILANEGIAQRESLSSMCKRNKAIAGINGSYFTWRGDPIGTLIINRKLISSPLYKRSVFGISDNDSLIFGNPDFSGTLKSDNISVRIDAVNQPRKGDSLVVYTPEYAKSTLTKEDGKEFVLVKGKIVGVQSKDALIPPDGVVVSAGGEKASLLSKLSLGKSIELDYSINSPWNTIKHAICGGPRLLSNGRVNINGKEEKFDNSIINGRHPRTAVAMTFDGDLLLIVVDGRKKDSPGMKLQELAEYLQRLGCMAAINLDGGGSTAMYLNGRIVNKPSDGSERRISNGILVTKR